MFLHCSLCYRAANASFIDFKFVCVSKVVYLCLLKRIGKLARAGLQADIISISLQDLFLFLYHCSECTCKWELLFLLCSAGHIERASCRLEYGVISCLLPGHYNQVFVCLLSRHYRCL